MVSPLGNIFAWEWAVLSGFVVHLLGLQKQTSTSNPKQLKKSICWLGYGVQNRGILVRFHAVGRKLFLSSASRPALAPTLQIPGVFPWGKASGVWSWSLPSSEEVMNEWIYTSTSHVYLHILYLRCIKPNITYPIRCCESKQLIKTVK